MAPQIPDKLYFKIGEVSELTGVEPYILRYWESEFSLIKPIRTKSNQRLYRKKDVLSIFKIKEMLYDKKFTIAGAKKQLKEDTAQSGQLALNFPNDYYRTMLKEIRDELKHISDMLIPLSNRRS
ncbi:MAG: MerR family transcriptional regulator [Desulfobacterota bacterium]|nr:MerR family transcriptional regulator [Thermodesulfobacteriota bacterium]